LDVSTWRYRKALKLLHTGAQQLELDLEVLAHAQPGFADLRLMRADRQVPYIIERTSITRTLTPTVTASTDPKDPKRSHWTLKLPQAGLPVTRLSCATRTILFERTMVLYELVDDERGVKYQRNLGSATWVLTPERKSRELSLSFDTAPLTDTLMLTTVNGDNPAIEIDNFRVFHPATRILFKAKSDDDLLLYYGNSQAAPPRYDLSLVANQLLAAQKSVAIPVAEQQLKKSAWGEGHAAGRGGVVFWGILAVVVIGLLFVIARLLPKAPQPERRFPNRLDRGFPTRRCLDVVYNADLEVGDTAGRETCATQPPRYALFTCGFWRNADDWSCKIIFPVSST